MESIEAEDLDEEDFKAGKEEEVVEASQENGEKEDTYLTRVKPQEDMLLVGEVSDCSIFFFFMKESIHAWHTKQFNSNFSLSFIDVNPLR